MNPLKPSGVRLPVECFCFLKPGLHAETLTSRNAMAAFVPLAAGEEVAVVAGGCCGGVELEVGTMGVAGLF